MQKNDRNVAVGMILAGKRLEDIARRFNVHRNTISRLKSKFAMTGSTDTLAGHGCPRITTRPQDIFILTRHLRNRFLSAESTARNIPGLRRISDRTVRNRLKEHGLKPCRPAVRPVLKVNHKRNRLTWARQRQHWNREWNRIMFTDASRSAFKVIHQAKCIGEQEKDTLMPVSVNETACVEDL